MHADNKHRPLSQCSGEESKGKTVLCPVADLLHGSPLGGLMYVSCEIRERLAILHGEVSSFYLKQFAQEAARKIHGVELVINRVKVVLPQ